MSNRRKKSEEYDCYECGAKMDKVDDVLVCPKCGHSVDIEDWICEAEEREEMESGFYDNDGYEFEEPECCRACGGPWPDCETSCTIFDD